MLSDERAAFEAWCFANGLMAESHGVRSESRACDVAWLAWQAATAVAEAAVKDAGGGEAVAILNCGEIGPNGEQEEFEIDCEYGALERFTSQNHGKKFKLYTRPQASAAVPEGFSLVPSKMVLTPESMEALMFTVGGTEVDNPSAPLDERWLTGVLFVGDVKDDDGTSIHGLHVYSDEYPEEGSTTLVEFDRAMLAASQQDVKDV